MYARPFIDSLEFAANGQQISGEIPLVAMSRLVDELSDTQGSLDYCVQGGVNREGIAVLDVRVTGQCQLQCQRCLEGMDYIVDLSSRLLLRDQESLDALEDDEDEFDSVLAEKHLDVVGLLEEEILLSLPIAPKHKAGSCKVLMDKGLVDDPGHPFAVLAKLKRH